MKVFEHYTANQDYQGGPIRAEEVTREMTLREYYAGLAMQGQLTSAGEASDPTPEGIAEWSAKYADALIAELNKEASDAE